VKLPGRRRARRERELDEELQAHLRIAIAERVAGGESPENAAANARRELGNLARVREETREAWGGVAVERFGQDLRFGLRILRRNPGVSGIAILCLTVGIGANAAVFSWIEGILFRPFPGVAHQERLAALAGTMRGQPGHEGVSWPDFADLRKSCRTIDAFIADRIMGATLSIGERAERAPGSIVSANYFEALGVRPVLGRGFRPEEETGRNAHPVTVISWRTWKERYKGDPAIIGKIQRLNGAPFTIVGVAPEGFDGTFVGYAMRFFVPMSMEEKFEPGGWKLEDRGARFIEPFVRVRAGVTLAQAQAEISAVARRLEAMYPDTNRGHGLRVYPLRLTPFNGAAELGPTLGIALAVVAAVLLIACANVGNLLLVRSFGRRHEMTVRLAIGAGRGRLFAQLLTEGLVLSALGAAGGLVVARLCRGALALFYPSRGTAIRLVGEIDWRVVAGAAAVCLVSTLLFGIVPALQAGRVDAAAVLKTEAAGVIGGHRKAWVRSALVLVQVALCFVLLVGTGLVWRSLERMRRLDPGFSTRGVLVTAVDMLGAGYDADRAKSVDAALLDRVRSLPGVESAAFARVMPLSLRSPSSGPVAVPGYVPPVDEQPTVEFVEVSPDYFSTTGIPLLSGREFARTDDGNGERVAVVNDTMAAKFWPGRSPVGETLVLKGRPLRVVGVARTSKYQSVSEAPKAFFYVPLAQNFSPTAALFMKTRLGPSEMTAAFGAALRAVDPNLAHFEVTTMSRQVEDSARGEQVAVAVLEIFGGLALLLAAIGLYGVLSYAVSQRMHEMGLRMALGATSRDLLRLVASQGMALTGSGIAAGLAAALLFTRLIQNLLFGVSSRDPAVFGSSAAVLIAAAVVACALPAWRAMRLDPWKALRE